MSNDKVPKTIPEALNRLSEFPSQYIAIHALFPKTFAYKCILLTPDDELRNSFEKIQSAIQGQYLKFLIMDRFSASIFEKTLGYSQSSQWSAQRTGHL
jgi:hypothetical protein